MLNPELYRYITLKKDPVIFFMSLFSPPEEVHYEIAQIGQTFFNELDNVTFRSVYVTVGDRCFYRYADQDVKREAVFSPMTRFQDSIVTSLVRVISVDELSIEHVDELFAQIQFDNLPNYPDYYLERFRAYFETPSDERISTDGMLLAQMISVFGSRKLDLKPADLVVLYLTEIHTSDILWMKHAVKKGIRTLVLSPKH